MKGSFEGGETLLRVFPFRGRQSRYFSWDSGSNQGGGARDVALAGPAARGLRALRRPAVRCRRRGPLRSGLKNARNHLPFLRGSFSAVSTATIATKYSFFQDFRDLQDLHSCAPLRFQNFSKKPSKFCRNENEISFFIRVFR